MTFRGSVEGAHIYAVVEHGPIYNKPAHYGAGHGHVTENVLAQLRRNLPYPTSTPLFPSSSVIVLPEHRSLCLSMVTYNFTPGNLPPECFLSDPSPTHTLGCFLDSMWGSSHPQSWVTSRPDCPPAVPVHSLSRVDSLLLHQMHGPGIPTTQLAIAGVHRV